jgi:SM-20-related protein
VCADFLTPALRLLVREDMERVKGEGGFHRTGTGQGGGLDVRHSVRGDSVHWLESPSVHPAQVQLMGKMDSLRLALNQELYLGLLEFEGHYASYPVDGFYRRHLDVFQQDDARCVTMIVYLNGDWCAADGGRLRVHDGETHQDIDPVGGTLVCFLSRQLEHEVLVSHAERNSFTGWYKTRHV